MEENFYQQQQEKVAAQQTPEPPPPAYMPAAKKPKMFLIILSAVLLVGIGTAGGYFLATNTKNTPTDIKIATVNTPTPGISSPTITPTSTPSALTTTWQKETISLYGLELQRPIDWTLTEVNRRPEPTGVGALYGHDCASYEIADKTKSILLTLNPPCGFDEGTGSQLPSDAVTVKQINPTSTIVRVYNNPPGTYTYGTNYSDSDPKDMSYIPIIGYGEKEKHVTLHNTLSITGNPTNKTALLDTMDKIVASLTKKL